MYAQSDINSNWLVKIGDSENSTRFTIDESEWQKVDLPHTFNPSGSTEIYREKKEAVYYTGPAWYRKKLFINEKLKSKRLFLHFDGAYIDTDVYLNGKKIGNHRGGFTAFAFEITRLVKYDHNNLISVRVNNEYNPDITPLGGGYVKFGGITRPVRLIVKEDLCISAVHFATTGVYCKPVKVSNEKAEFEIETVLNSSASTRKYKLICSIIDKDGKVLEKESSKGNIKNGQWHVATPMSLTKPTLWNGLENPYLYKIKVELYNGKKRVDEITETTGFKTVSVDKDKGFFLNGKSYPLYGLAPHQYYRGIAIWGLFNEIRYDSFKGVDGVPTAEELNRITKELDASRVTCGVSWKQGIRNDVADISGWNRYQGWYWNAYYGGPNDFSWLDKIHETYPERKLGITEYGAGGATKHFDQNRKVAPYNQDQFHPVDFYNYSHEEHWKETTKRPWLWGTFIWTLNEFLIPNYDQGRASFLHDKGLVGENRIDKKDAYYYYKANWKKEPVFHLAYKQFDIRLEEQSEVTVYSNLDEVNLSVNGVEMGILKNAPYGINRWCNINLKSGKNTIVVDIWESTVSWADAILPLQT